jgi:tetraacyldisaccharide 4'-kinase
MRLRRTLYETGLGVAAAPSTPVISVGNLTLGGTGKTPAVAWVISRLIEAGITPAAISRGYSGAEGGVCVVSDGAGAVLSSPPASDEAVMLARMFPRSPVVTGRDRPAAARRAAELGAGAIVADDGFQHLALPRCFDLVVLRGDRPFGNGRVFPAGAMREPLGALRRADAILLTGLGGLAVHERLRSLSPDTKIFEGMLTPSALLDLGGGPAGEPADLGGAAVVAVSGIGNPGGFARSLAALGARVLESLVFSDHAAYGGEELERIAAAIEKTGADFAVTTEKDAVKLGALAGDERFRVLRAEMKVNGGDELARLIFEAAGLGPEAGEGQG